MTIKYYIECDLTFALDICELLEGTNYGRDGDDRFPEKRSRTFQFGFHIFLVICNHDRQDASILFIVNGRRR